MQGFLIDLVIFFRGRLTREPINTPMVAMRTHVLLLALAVLEMIGGYMYCSCQINTMQWDVSRWTKARGDQYVVLLRHPGSGAKTMKHF